MAKKKSPMGLLGILAVCAVIGVIIWAATGAVTDGLLGAAVSSIVGVGSVAGRAISPGRDTVATVQRDFAALAREVRNGEQLDRETATIIGDNDELLRRIRAARGIDPDGLVDNTRGDGGVSGRAGD